MWALETSQKGSSLVSWAVKATGKKSTSRFPDSVNITLVVMQPSRISAVRYVSCFLFKLPQGDGQDFLDYSVCPGGEKIINWIFYQPLPILQLQGISFSWKPKWLHNFPLSTECSGLMLMGFNKLKISHFQRAASMIFFCFIGFPNVLREKK